MGKILEEIIGKIESIIGSGLKRGYVKRLPMLYKIYCIAIERFLLLYMTKQLARHEMNII